MFQIEEYAGFDEALDDIMVKDADHVFIRHSYMKGRHILPHVHPEDDEWVIASRGHIKISSQGEEKELHLHGEKVIVVYYPAGRDHGLARARVSHERAMGYPRAVDISRFTRAALQLHGRAILAIMEDFIHRLTPSRLRLNVGNANR